MVSTRQSRNKMWIANVLFVREWVQKRVDYKICAQSVVCLRLTWSKIETTIGKVEGNNSLKIASTSTNINLKKAFPIVSDFADNWLVYCKLVLNGPTRASFSFFSATILQNNDWLQCDCWRSRRRAHLTTVQNWFLWSGKKCTRWQPTYLPTYIT